MQLRMILSHQRPEHLHRCIRVAGIPICARCSGTYPTLLVGFALLMGLHGRYGALLAERSWESWVLVALALPAVVDWMRSRVDPFRGTNRGRILTGVLLGLSLARVVYLNAVDFMNGTVLELGGFFVASVVIGELVARAYGEEDEGQGLEPLDDPTPGDPTPEGRAGAREAGLEQAAVDGAGGAVSEGDATGPSR